MISEYGVPGIVVFLILRDVFSFIKGRSNGSSPDTAILVKEMHAAHLGPQALDKDNNLKWYGTSAEIQTARHKDLLDIQHRILKAIEKNGVR